MGWQGMCVAIGFAVGSALASRAAAAQANDAGAKVNIEVDLSSQRMHVQLPDGKLYDWPISSGRPGLDTPSGHFGVEWMDADHVSREYDGAPMPYAIFFNLEGDAIHGSYQKAFGRPQSHGCVRLPVADAKILFAAVKTYGAKIDIFRTARRRFPILSAQRRTPANPPHRDWRTAATSHGGYGYANDGSRERAATPYSRGSYSAGPIELPILSWLGLPMRRDRD